ncbi:MAG: type I restriction enzyme HsdR N-terminal domain-containing protein [Saprospiraceae bacterium]|nr:type I restriction enzyme HsdR N-terminal domain-containing protein [Saprospiraceae bacterium]MDW8228993.1 type I restriction enzyme HsdR N-terminal domain-containing protein [Saprospiraceae bacterium]
MLLQLDFWTYHSRLRRSEKDGQVFVFDPIRRKHVTLTPEEGLRQLVVQYLLHTKQYPPSHIRVEIGLLLNGMPRRCDIAVFDPHLQPWLLVECKSPKVPLTQTTFEQVARYNLTFRAPFLAITNGEATFCAQLDSEHGAFAFLNDFPEYPLQNAQKPTRAKDLP